MKKITLLLAFVFALTAAYAQKLKGSGPLVEQDLRVENFTGISLNFSGDVFITQGDRYAVRVQGQQNLIDDLNTEIEDGIWKIKFKSRNVDYKSKFHVYITMPTLTYAKVNGSGAITSKGKFTNLDRLTAGVHGSGDLDLDIEADALTVKVTGSGDARFSGTANAVNVSLTGSGDYDGYNLRGKNCEAKLTGSGDIEIHATEFLLAEVIGSGDIDYKGSPQVKAKVRGSGDIDGN